MAFFIIFSSALSEADRALMTTPVPVLFRFHKLETAVDFRITLKVQIDG